MNTTRVMRTLIWKDLRENVRWLPLGLFVIGVVCWMVRPSQLNHMAQGLLAIDLITQFAIVTPLLAFVLGIVQSYLDLQPSAAAYLHHRSVTAREVFLAKTVAGFALYAIAIAVPVMSLVAWIAYRGMDSYPLRPAQVIPAVVFSLVAFAMHPAAVMMMSRDASWWGIRFIPLLPAAAILIPFFVALRTGGLWAAGVGILVTVPLVLWLIVIALQSWREPSGEAALRSNQGLVKHWLMPTYLVIGLLLGLVAVVTGGLGVIEDAGRSGIYVREPHTAVAVDEASGQPWLITYASTLNEQTGIYEESILGADLVESDKSVDPLRPVAPDRQFRDLVRLAPVGENYYLSDGFFTPLLQLEETPFVYSYDSRGYLICYSRKPELTWTHTLAVDGFGPRGDLQGRPFTTNPKALGAVIFNTFGSSRHSTPLIDGQGVYMVAGQPLSIRTLIELPIDAAAVLDVEKDRAPRLILQNGRKLFEYQFLDADGSDRWYNSANAYSYPSNFSPERRTLADLQLSAKLVNTYELPGGVQGSGYLQLVRGKDGLLAVAYDRPTQILRLSPAVGESPASYETLAFTVPNSVIHESQQDRIKGTVLFSGLFPGVFGVVLAGVATWLSASGRVEPPLWEYIMHYPIQSTTLLISYGFVSLLALWLTMHAAHRRGLSRSQRFAWYGSVLLLGLAAPLSVAALYRKVIHETCSKCDSPRRVDMATCEHCGADWEPPLREGIEIIDRESSRTYSDGAAV